MISGRLGFHTVGQRIVDEIAQANEDANAADLDRACMVPAVIAWDDCSCGMLAVSLYRTYLTTTFPVDDAGNPVAAGACGSSFIVGDFAIQLIRCAPAMDSRGNPPSCEAQDASSQEVISDAYLVQTTVACLLQTMEDDGDIVAYEVRGSEYTGPQGGCVGSETHVLVALERR